ncbi:hypothetical protein HK104_003165, partial [Borealophlyctis nickersoniae]
AGNGVREERVMVGKRKRKEAETNVAMRGSTKRGVGKRKREEAETETNVATRGRKKRKG